MDFGAKVAHLLQQLVSVSFVLKLHLMFDDRLALLTVELTS